VVRGYGIVEKGCEGNEAVERRRVVEDGVVAQGWCGARLVGGKPASGGGAARSLKLPSIIHPRLTMAQCAGKGPG
jgi:hypothetical protein